MTNLTLTLNLAVAGTPMDEWGRSMLERALMLWIESSYPNLRVIDSKADGWQERERQAGTKIVNH